MSPSLHQAIYAWHGMKAPVQSVSAPPAILTISATGVSTPILLTKNIKQFFTRISKNALATPEARTKHLRGLTPVVNDYM